VRILEVINKTTPFFEKNGVESPRLTIELMLAHVLQKKRLQLYLEFERDVDETALARLREMVRRRAEGEPLQYILGETEFCGLKMMVDRRVLIPRPETELLVETALNEMKDAANPVIFDVCTGSGCVAIALAKKRPGSEVWALDASADALEVAGANAKLHGLEKLIRFSQGDLLSAMTVSLRADAIVSNPPYVADGDMARLPKEVGKFEPAQALNGGVDGLEVYRRLIAQASSFLKPTGFVALELGAGQRTAVERLLEPVGLRVTQVVKDLQGHDRVMVARAAAPTE
jgi:release factor glutamine methyltransferase